MWDILKINGNIDFVNTIVAGIPTHGREEPGMRNLCRRSRRQGGTQNSEQGAQLFHIEL